MELLLSPASKVLNNWFEVMIYVILLHDGGKKLLSNPIVGLRLHVMVPTRPPWSRRNAHSR